MSSRGWNAGSLGPGRVGHAQCQASLTCRGNGLICSSTSWGTEAWKKSDTMTWLTCRTGIEAGNGRP